MQEIEHNNISRQKEMSSDLLNLKENVKPFHITISSKLFNSVKDKFLSPKNHKTFTKFPNSIYLNSNKSNLLKSTNIDKNNNYKIDFKLEDKNPKTPDITKKLNGTLKIDKKISTINDKYYCKKKLFPHKFLNKSNSQNNFFSADNSYKNIYTGIKKISNLSYYSYNKLAKDKFNKSNSFNSLDSQLMTKSNTIYFNSSLDDFYNKTNIFNIVSPLRKIKKKKYPILSPKSYNINFINNLINLYDKNNENKIKNENIQKNDDNNKIDEINEEKEESQDKKIFNVLGFDSFNQISLKTLFKKNAAKVKSGILDEILVDRKINNNDLFLHPFSNSYGSLLDTMSEKVGFMKGSIDILYPKITQKKYQLRTIQKKKELNRLNDDSQENNENQKNEIKNNIYNINKEKKVFQSIFTKYPINIKHNGRNICFSKFYSYKGLKHLLRKKPKKNISV